MRKITILTHLRRRVLAGEKPEFLKPSALATKQVCRVLFAPQQRRAYAILRVMGFGRVEAFHAAFGEVLRGTPELFEEAARHYEKTTCYAEEVEEILDNTPPAEIEFEHEARLSEMTVSVREQAELTHAYINKYYAPAPDRDMTVGDVHGYNAAVEACRAELREQDEEDARDAAANSEQFSQAGEMPVDRTANELAERYKGWGLTDRAERGYEERRDGAAKRASFFFKGKRA